MEEIQKIDRNFKVKTKLSKENVAIYDVCDEPFRVYGLMLPKDNNDFFRRMPDKVASEISDGIMALHTKTTGGRVRFATNSSYIAIRAEMNDIAKLSHMTLTGTAGFDLYKTENGLEKYVCTFVPPQSVCEENGYSSQIVLPERKMYDYTLNFPLYSDIKKVYIILDDDAEVKSAAEYNNSEPIIYYGSSVTQGACASRPGNTYQSIISRRYNWDFINLGFSGNAKGEEAMAKYIASLKMSALVFDYDFNAPDLEYLKNTYEKFLHIIREKHSKTPIICVSKPFCRTQTDFERKNYIKETVERWVDKGDNKIFFVDGNKFKDTFNAGDSIVVDGSHPNDLGFWCMAELIGTTLYECAI